MDFFVRLKLFQIKFPATKNKIFRESEIKFFVFFGAENKKKTTTVYREPSAESLLFTPQK